MKVSSRLKEVKIGQLDLRPPVLIDRTDSLKNAVEAMRKQRSGVALVCENGKLVGIFTERDLLNRVIGEKVIYSESIERYITPNPAKLSLEDSVADAMRIMQQGDYRNIPLVDADGKAAGVVTVREIITFFAEHFPQEALNLPPDNDNTILQAEGA